MRRLLIMVALAGLTAASVVVHTAAARPPRGASVSGFVNTVTFHGDRGRTGWNADETVLTPSAVSGGSFGPLWNSPVLDAATVNGQSQPPHIYATPLYVDSVTISGGPFKGATVGVVFVATGAGWVYGIKAFDTAAPTSIAPGTILWKSFLGPPSAGTDGGVAIGVLGTPFIDLNTSPPRLYVAADVNDGQSRTWKVFAVDITSGAVMPGWPLSINDSTVQPVTVNGPATMQPPAAMSQRGALNLDAGGRTLYVPFGAYGDGGTGWLVAVDTGVRAGGATVSPSLASAFAGAPSTAPTANGGMWGSGGVAVDGAGNVFDTTGNSPNGSGPGAGIWGNTLLEWSPGTPLQLSGTYSPWNYCQMDQFDTDLGGSSPVIVPTLASSPPTTTPDLLAIGGKQGNAYIINRDRLPGRIDHRPHCSTDSSSDGSLLPPGNQPQFGRPGPLNIFGPYSEDQYNQTDFAKARSTPAYFRTSDGTTYLFYSGSTKTAVGQRTVKPPSLVRTKVNIGSTGAAYLSNDASDSSLSFLTPGSPVVTSSGTTNPIVWVVDANVYRTQSLTAPGIAHPVLYAVDASTMKPLWTSTQSMLDIGGKYNHPIIAHGAVFVATDRLQAFGLGATQPRVTTVDDAVQGTGQNQFHYVGSWGHCTSGCIANSYAGTVSLTDVTNDYATITFTGTKVAFYTDERNNRAIAGLSIDGGTEVSVDTYSPKDGGDVLVWTSPVLRSGPHTLKVRNTGRRNSQSTGHRVSIDRVDITSG